jgi:putative oxidoreductase
MTDTKLLIPPLGRIYTAVAPFTELLIRLMAGGSLAFHGYQIVFGNIAGAGRFFESVGFEDGVMWAWIVGILELVCGLLLALGLLTRLVAGPIIVFMIVAIVSYHWDNGYNWESRGVEYPLFWALVVFHFLIRGGGQLSLDAVIGREI